MRRTVFIILLAMISLSSVGQRISSKELENIVDEFGVDSALRAVRPISEIYLIDSSLALFIAEKCVDLKNNSRQFSYFSDVGLVMKNEFFNWKALEILESFKSVFYRVVSKQYNAFVIPDEIFHILSFQDDKAIIPVLKAEFSFWERKADSIRTTYPSRTKRFFQSLRGTPPYERFFYDCRENCFKLAWILNKLGDSEFSSERVNATRQQLVPFLRDYNMRSFRFKPIRSDTVQLDRSYRSIDEIDFHNEIEFIKLKDNLEGYNCWNQMITNNKTAIFDIGCQRAPLAGRGKTIWLELIGGDRLRVSVISIWMS